MGALGGAGLRRLRMLVSNNHKWVNDPMARRAILDMALTDMVLTLPQAQWLVDGIGQRFDDLVVLSLVLPVAVRCMPGSDAASAQDHAPGHVTDQRNDAFEFVRRNLDGTNDSLDKLIGMIGVERYRFNAHNPTGQWRLDLARDDHRELATLFVDLC